jgi:hypothetical protein
MVGAYVAAGIIGGQPVLFLACSPSTSATRQHGTRTPQPRGMHGRVWPPLWGPGRGQRPLAAGPATWWHAASRHLGTPSHCRSFTPGPSNYTHGQPQGGLMVSPTPRQITRGGTDMSVPLTTRERLTGAVLLQQQQLQPWRPGCLSAAVAAACAVVAVGGCDSCVVVFLSRCRW